MPKISAVIVAAGKGSRMKIDQNKIFCSLGGKPLLAHTLSLFERNECIGEIILVCRADEMDQCRAIAQTYHISKITKFVPGGAERKDSVYHGICHVNPSADYIAIHDAARPFLSQELLNLVLTEAQNHRAAVLGVPCKDTIKCCREGYIINTPDRSTLWAVQTPQVFERDLIIKAYEAASPDIVFTDDCSYVEAMGIPPYMVLSDYNNIKITTPEDLAYANFMLNK